MNILILCGGASSERTVSLSSGDAVANWCSSLGHHTLKYDPEHPGTTFDSGTLIAPKAIGTEAPMVNSSESFDARVVRGLLDTIEEHGINLVFPILHGGYGEDGSLQALLEWTGIAYTGSGPRSCAVSMHKPTAKALMAQAGIAVAKGFEIAAHELDDETRIRNRVRDEVGYPAIVKPQSGGSTVGLTVLNTESQLPDALQLIREQRDGALVESYFKGREIAAAVVDGSALPLVEIIPKAGIYDYANKYTSGRTEYVCPAELSADVTQSIQRSAVSVFNALGARGFARVDFLVDDQKFICLELNSLPGMTATSLVPKAARAHGWSPEELISRILETAWTPSGTAANQRY